MGRYWERWYPYALSAVAGIAACYYISAYQVLLPSTTKDLFQAVINISAIAVGFLATAKSILLSIDQRRAIRFLKQAGGYSDLVKYLMEAVQWCFLTTIFSAAWLLLNENYSSDWYLYGFAIWFALAVLAALSCFRVIRLFSLILLSSEQSSGN